MTIIIRTELTSNIIDVGGCSERLMYMRLQTDGNSKKYFRYELIFPTYGIWRNSKNDLLGASK